MYETGKGTEKSLRVALEWYRRAAERGHLPATCAVALILKFGSEELQDHSEAAKLFQQAAESGSSMGALQLADCLERGFGVPVDKAAARKWYFRAAELKDESTGAAHAAIATLYRMGRLDLPVDGQKAEEWAKSSRDIRDALMTSNLNSGGGDHCS
jgi:TPR repeat protein